MKNVLKMALAVRSAFIVLSCLIAACGIIKPGKWITLLPDTSVIV